MYIYTSAIRRILSVLLTFAALLSGIKQTEIQPSTVGRAAVSYAFTDSSPFSAAGTVSVSSQEAGTYRLYWGDRKGEKLTMRVSGDFVAEYTEFTTVEVKGGKGSVTLNNFLAVPDGAECIIAEKAGKKYGETKLPSTKIKKNAQELYRFGALSDVHFNRYDLSGGDDAEITFSNALSFLDCCGVSLVGMSGDLSSASEESAYIKFGNISSEYDFPVFTCTGNHDCLTDGTVDLKAWSANVNKEVYSVPRGAGVTDVAPNDIDFVYAPPELGGDAFVFFSQVYWDYAAPESRLVTDEQLKWLEGVLEKYKNKTVYLFFHTFLSNCLTLDAGTGQGNLLAPNGAYYALIYTEGAADQTKFKSLLAKYKNVVWFNGHSHWKYEDMSRYNPLGNITNYGGTYALMVHLSSVTSPRSVSKLSLFGLDNPLYHSEGMLVRVYSNRICFTAIDFMQGKILSYADYSAARQEK